MDKIKYLKASDDNGMQYIGAVYKNKLVGKVWFKCHNGDTWLYYIGVDKTFRNLPEARIGSHLLNIFELECYSKRARNVEGKYYPKDESGAVVSAFYKKNGYSISREDYEQIVWKNIEEVKPLDVEVEAVDYEVFEKYSNRNDSESESNFEKEGEA